jgi:iron complex transport system permease protein
VTLIYRRVTLSRVLQISALMLLIFLVVCIVSLSLGSVHIGFIEVLKSLIGSSTGESSLSSQEELIIFSVRLPRIIFAGIVGASLSLGGVIFQAILRNPLADPYILGISGGSALGAIIGIVIGAGSFYLGIPLLAFVGALATVFLVFVVAGSVRGPLSDNSLLLSGVVVNAFFSAAILFFLSIVNSMELHSITFWLMGDLSGASAKEISFAAVCLLTGFVLLYAQSRKLNLIVQGEDTAQQLGVHVEETKRMLLIITSLIISVAVSLAGIIGFVGIMVPHLMRLVFGSDHRLLLPVSALFGASFLIIADTIARIVLAPAELPVGVITALCGAPYFIFLLKRNKY